MMFHGWAIALSVCSAATFFLGLLAVICGVRVLRYWDHGSDTPLQIRLEGEIWLTSALMQYGLVFQVLSLLLLVLAADTFSSLLVGAMCATGAFLANDYGIPALLVKIVMVFFCGFWLILHRLDLQSEFYPLVRAKYWYLLLLVPLLAVDGAVQSAYLFMLEPDVITSCCGVVFKPDAGNGFNLLDPYSTPFVLLLFYALAIFLLLIGMLLYRQMKKHSQGCRAILCGFYASGWALFFPVSIWAITIFFSSYIYAMPSHRCPFDILQPEYGYIGYPIYLSLFLATFLGIACGIAALVRRYAGLADPVSIFHRTALPMSLILLLIFLVITSYAPLQYIVAGGEV
jgi:hypothetical protein